MCVGRAVGDIFHLSKFSRLKGFSGWASQNIRKFPHINHTTPEHFPCGERSQNTHIAQLLNFASLIAFIRLYGLAQQTCLAKRKWKTVNHK